MLVLLAALLSDPVLLRAQYEEGQLLELTLTFELAPVEEPAEAADESAGVTQTRYAITASELVVAVGSDGTATCSWQSERITGRLQLADPQAPTLLFNSTLAASAKSELEAQAFSPYVELDTLGFRSEAAPDGCRRLLDPDAARGRVPVEREFAEAVLALQSWTLPAEPVEPGAEWVGKDGRRFRYVGADADGRHRIAVQIVRSRTPQSDDPSAAESPAPEEANGTLWFDPELKRIAELELVQILPDGTEARTAWTLKEGDELRFGF